MVAIGHERTVARLTTAIALLEASTQEAEDAPHTE
jgi:hypothetical protein